MTPQYTVNPSFFTSRTLRGCILGITFFAFFSGFAQTLFGVDLERLHIFMFNLTSGGFILICFTENREFPSLKSFLFLGFSIIFSVFAFLEMYPAAIAASIILFLIVEIIRIRTFGFFPAGFFSLQEDISRKFHMASLLCLSISLALSSVVILNNEYFHWIILKKLTLNVFFLGFSFPVSLITMSIVFYFIRRPDSFIMVFIENFFFWIINLGVIIFFLFILLQLGIPEFIAAMVLALSVIMVFLFFSIYGIDTQQKSFLISGIFFLLSTAITGVLYILIKKVPFLYTAYGRDLLGMHANLSLYGWNLSGLLVIIRWNDFPLRLNSKKLIIFHWITIGILTSAGRGSAVWAAAAIISFLFFLAIFLTGKNRFMHNRDSFLCK